MNRVTDHIRFAVCFAGLGYIVLWPVTVHDAVPASTEAALICGSYFDALCRLPQPLTLSPGLHLAGHASAIAMIAICFGRRLLRWRRKAALAPHLPSSVVDARLNRAGKPAPAAPPQQCRPKWVRPRREFGLRGQPH